MTKKKTNPVIWIIIVVVILLILNGNIDLSNLFSVSPQGLIGSPSLGGSGGGLG